MRRKDIEKKLNNMISNNVPNVIDDVIEECKEKRRNVFMENNEEKKRNFRIMPLLAYSFSFVFICLIGFFGFNHYTNNTIESIIEFDVNPSIEVKINKNEKIKNVIALNEDGEKVLEGMDLKNVSLNVGVNAIIGSMVKNGYISDIQNSILVSVKNDDKAKAKKLESKLSTEIEKILSVKNIDSSVLSQSYDTNNDIETLSKKYNISEGKVTLINKVLKSELKDASGENYSFETLATLTINELKLLLESKNVEVNDVTSKGTSSEKSLIGKDKAKEIALNHAKVKNHKELEIELDYERKTLVYEVEFKSGIYEYDYEIDAKTGKILKSIVEKDDDKHEKDNDKYDDDKYDDDRYDRDDDDDDEDDD